MNNDHKFYDGYFNKSLTGYFILGTQYKWQNIVLYMCILVYELMYIYKITNN